MRRHSNWHNETYYLKTTFRPVAGPEKLTEKYPKFRGMTLGLVCGGWYLRNDITGQYCRLPHFLGWTLRGEDRFTYWLGPYAFVNDFQATTEGKYLIKALEYPRLRTDVQNKVDNILDTYKYWVQVDEQMINILKERDRRK